MSFNLHKSVIGIILLIFLSLSSCEKIAENIFSDKDDLEMGASIDKEIHSKPDQFHIIENQALKNYIQSIVKQIIRSKEIKKRNIFSYKITLLKDDKTINAFCTPGGYIYIYTGLLKFLENEASLAAVLAHEIAHAEKRHVRQRMISSIGIQIILTALLGDDSSVLKETGLKIFGDLALLSNSRDDELEADEWGFLYLKSSPYYAGAMSFFFEKIARKEKTIRNKALESLLSTHPIPEERLKINSIRVQKAKIPKPTPSNLLETRYKSMIKKHLRIENKLKNEDFEDKG